MKKLFVIPVMFLYILAVSGIMIHLHYCGKQLASWNVYAKNNGCGTGDDDCSSKEKQGKTHTCCKDKVIAAKLAHDQHHVDFLKLKVAATELVFISPLFPLATPDLFNASAEDSGIHQPNAPPGLWENIPLYKLHTRFTYYG